MGNVVKIMGGLGNQLFQYAFSKNLEKYSDVELDLSFYNSEANHTELIPERHLALDKFNLTYQEYKPKARVLVQIEEDKFDPKEKYDNTYFWGYWQDPKYLKNIDLDIHLKNEYVTPTMRAMTNVLSRQNSVGIHVRRGDYEALGYALPLDYYEQAIDAIKDVVKDPCFIAFSDDPKWCSRNLPEEVSIYFNINSNGDHEDFYLMSKCKHNIIANSSFSYLAAYLNENDNTVIAPKDWKITKSPVKDERWILL